MARTLLGQTTFKAEERLQFVLHRIGLNKYECFIITFLLLSLILLIYESLQTLKTDVFVMLN